MLEICPIALNKRILETNNESRTIIFSKAYLIGLHERVKRALFVNTRENA